MLNKINSAELMNEMELDKVAGGIFIPPGMPKFIPNPPEKDRYIPPATPYPYVEPIPVPPNPSIPAPKFFQ